MTLRLTSESIPIDDDATSRTPVATVGPVPVWKRSCDLFVGSLSLLLLAPILIVAVGLVRATSRGPVLYRQARLGRGERPFVMLKLRTMYSSADDHGAGKLAIQRELQGSAAPDPNTLLYRPDRDPRVTPVGRLLRRLSIDELPQLFNVLKGEMSLIGPRPAPPSEVELFTPEQRRRHVVLPGMTGLWQISGRNRLNSSEMLELDVEYAETLSFQRDLSILLRTPYAVLIERHTR